MPILLWLELMTSLVYYSTHEIICSWSMMSYSMYYKIILTHTSIILVYDIIVILNDIIWPWKNISHIIRYGPYHIWYDSYHITYNMIICIWYHDIFHVWYHSINLAISFTISESYSISVYRALLYDIMCPLHNVRHLRPVSWIHTLISTTDFVITSS